MLRSRSFERPPWLHEIDPMQKFRYAKADLRFPEVGGVAPRTLWLGPGIRRNASSLALQPLTRRAVMNRAPQSDATRATYRREFDVFRRSTIESITLALRGCLLDDQNRHTSYSGRPSRIRTTANASRTASCG